LIFGRIFYAELPGPKGPHWHVSHFDFIENPIEEPIRPLKSACFNPVSFFCAFVKKRDLLFDSFIFVGV